jgi:hypothetical protein
VGLVLCEHPIPLPMFSLFWLSPLLPVLSPIIIHPMTLFYKCHIHLIAHSIPPTPPCPLPPIFAFLLYIWTIFFATTTIPHHYAFKDTVVQVTDPPNRPLHPPFPSLSPVPPFSLFYCIYGRFFLLPPPFSLTIHLL